MKKIFLLIVIAFSIAANARTSKVSLQASGLTCSMCSNAVYKALKTLDFVQEVEADIKTYTFEIIFKKDADIDFDKIRRKVEDAGFSVTNFVATIFFDNLQVISSKPVKIEEKTFLFVNTSDLVLNGVKNVRILDKGFVSQKEYKKNGLPVLSPRSYHATI